MQFKRLTSSAFGLLAVGGVAWGCSRQASDCNANENCGPYEAEAGSGSAGTSAGGRGGSANGGSAGTSSVSGSSGRSSAGAGGETGSSGAAGAGGAEPCDASKTPTAESCLVDDAHGVFVAPTGNDSNVGSMSEPVKTISKGIQLGQAGGKFVIACDATYDERVNIVAGVELYGGFSCPGGSGSAWTLETDGKAKVAPSIRGIALSVASPVVPVVIENFEFDAQDGVLAGESSIAAFVNDSTKVTLTSVKLVAGKGVDGANGTVTAVTFPTQIDLNGHAAMGNTGGVPNMISCPAGGTTKGGVGGNGGSAATGGGVGLPALGGGTPGTLGAGCGASPSGSGGDGANAAPAPAALGATSLGTITATGWSGISGSDGTPGTPGQGGGGGTGADSGGGGGGGGAGGCGGAGAIAGKAGGSSIALLVRSSTVLVVSSDLNATDAGKGGAGIAGQPGQTVTGSAGVQVPDGCQGGKGGKGGAGGASGGGAGGISVGIAWTGTMAMDPTPTAMMATTFMTGAFGAKGPGGAIGSNDGIDGVKQDVLKVQ